VQTIARVGIIFFFLLLLFGSGICTSAFTQFRKKVLLVRKVWRGRPELLKGQWGGCLPPLQKPVVCGMAIYSFRKIYGIKMR